MVVVLALVIVIGSVMYLCKRAKWIYQHTRLLYWAIVAITTVDISPVTPLGKFVASVFMLMGYGIIAVPTDHYHGDGTGPEAEA